MLRCATLTDEQYYNYIDKHSLELSLDKPVRMLQIRPDGSCREVITSACDAESKFHHEWVTSSVFDNIGIIYEDDWDETAGENIISGCLKEFRNDTVTGDIYLFYSELDDCYGIDNLTDNQIQLIFNYIKEKGFELSI